MLETRPQTETWPALPYAEWQDTLATLHMWLQIVGKIRLKQSPPMNHWWHVTLYVSSRGLTTSAMPYRDSREFQIDFDFIEQQLIVQECDGGKRSFALEPMPVAQFYTKLMDALRSLNVDVAIRTQPNEVPEAIAFDKDYTHAAYDKTYAFRFWRVLLQVDRLFKIFRSGFVGKASPVHLFWGGPDVAVTRFSSRPAPPHPGGIPNMPDWATREAYSHEVSSAGFWPGGFGRDAAFYSYAYPEPQGFAQAQVEPAAAHYDDQLREFLLPYDDVRRSDDPDSMVLAFLQSAYDAAADLGKWDRSSLERRLPKPLALYFATESSGDIAAQTQLFTHDALVHDEGRDYRGLEAIAAWKQQIRQRFQYECEPITSWRDGERVAVLVKLSGNFPGTPVTLHFEFRLKDDKIGSLVIDHE